MSHNLDSMILLDFFRFGMFHDSMIYETERSLSVISRNACSLQLAGETQIPVSVDHLFKCCLIVSQLY